MLDAENCEKIIKALEQEPCEDAISRDAVLKIIEKWYENKSDIEDLIILITYMSSVTQKSETVTEFADRCRECGKMRKGHWIWNIEKGYCKCSKCGIGMGHTEFDYCPNCGARMIEPQERQESEG